MIEFLKSMTMSVAGIIVFGSVCEMILPDGSFKKYLHLAIGLMLILAFLSPLSDREGKADVEIPKIEAESIETVQSEDVLRLYANKLGKRVEREIKDRTGTDTEVSCVVSSEEKTFGAIEKFEIVCTSGIEDEIYAVAREVFDVPRERVVIYESGR